MCGLPVQNVAAAASMSPATASGIIGAQITFTATGLTAEETYDVEVNDVVLHNDLVAPASGVLSFTAAATVVGQNKIELVNSTADVVATSYITGQDILVDIMPYIMLMVGIGILFGIVKELKF